PYRSHRGDPNYSYLKNRWVQLTLGGRTCYGQIEDAGPGEYHDAAYVFGANDARPANTRYGGAGLDASPARTGRLALAGPDGITPGISWRFVPASAVPPRPWRRLVTTSGMRWPRGSGRRPTRGCGSPRGRGGRRARARMP